MLLQMQEHFFYLQAQFLRNKKSIFNNFIEYIQRLNYLDLENFKI